MKRKYVYALLATPFLLALICLFVLPSSTREIFLYEFKHKAQALMGYEAEPVMGADGSSGLRIEHPEEYGGVAPPKGDEDTTTSE